MNGPYKIGTLARLTGFSPALLRAWERRFGLIVPERGEGGQRVYGDSDLVLLRRVSALLAWRRAIGEIARLDRATLRSTAPVSAAAGPVAVESLRERIVTAAVALNARGVSAALDEAFATMAADHVVSDIIEPSAIAVGILWKSGTCTVASEHMVSDQFLHRLGRLLEAAQPPDADAPQVVAAYFPDEHHQLGLRIVAWHLARHGVGVVYLGSSMPLEDLALACRTSRPHAVLFSVTRRPAFTRHMTALTRLFPEAVVDRLFVGDQGVPPDARSTAHRIVFPCDTPLSTVVQRIVSDVGRVRAKPRARRQTAR